MTPVPIVAARPLDALCLDGAAIYSKLIAIRFIAREMTATKREPSKLRQHVVLERDCVRCAAA
jgi:hypothetical protein